MDLGKISYYIAKGLRLLLQRPAIYKSELHYRSRVSSGSQLSRVKLGRYSYIGHDCFLNNVEVGAFCSIADGCKIGGAAHQMNYVSTSPVFVDKCNILKTNFAYHVDAPSIRTTIENDVWIGMGCHIKEGVCIHTGAIVGMGSVVTKDISPYEIWAGNPAKKIRNRFDSDISQRLLETKWWEYSDEKLKEYGDMFDNPEKFLQMDMLDL